MDTLEALVLGLIQGLTEFLPVSSSGHIELGKELLGIDLGEGGDNVMFTILVHGATALATIIVFRKDIAHIIRQLLRFSWTDSTNYVLFIIISMIPAGLVGVFFKDEIEATLSGNIFLVGCMLLVTGGLLLLSQFMRPKKRGFLNYWKALVIGIAQMVAILPGISRSGSTISVALLLGINREKAARFSFLMVLPLILGAMAKELMELDTATTQLGSTQLIVGFVAAFFSGLLACTWMVKLVKRSKLGYFAMYCFAIGLIAIIGSFVG